MQASPTREHNGSKGDGLAFDFGSHGGVVVHNMQLSCSVQAFTMKGFKRLPACHILQGTLPRKAACRRSASLSVPTRINIHSLDCPSCPSYKLRPAQPLNFWGEWRRTAKQEHREQVVVAYLARQPRCIFFSTACSRGLEGKICGARTCLQLLSKIEARVEGAKTGQKKHHFPKTPHLFKPAAKSNV